MASESLTFDIFANDRASEVFRRIGQQASDASGNVRGLGDRLDKLGSRVATARVALEGDKDAQHSLDVLTAKLIRLGRQAANPNISIDGLARVQADISAVSLELDKLGKKKTNIFLKVAGAGALAPSAGGAALALSPALIPVAGALAAATGAIAVSLGAATIGAGAFGLLAKTTYTQAATGANAVQAAQDKYNVAIATGTKHAVAYRAEQRAILLAYSEMSPQQIALSKQIGDLQNAWQGVKASLTPVVSGALLPWVGALTSAMKFLAPIVAPVAAVFKAWGQTIDQYFKSSAGSAEIGKLATAFGKFSALQLTDLGIFFTAVGHAIFNLGKDIGGSSANFYTFGTDLTRWGLAFEKWSASKAARDDVNKFIRYLKDNGSTLVSIARDLAKFIPGITAGASTVGTLEFQALSTFLGWVNKLPAGWVKPITELAGAMLLLSKTGVLKVGVTLVGTAAKLLGFGGTLSLAGGTAAAEMRAAMVSGGAAAAAEIRAAMVGGGAAGAGEGAAGGAAGGAAASGGIRGAIAGALGSGAFLTGVGAAGAAAIAGGLFLRLREDLKGGAKALISDITTFIGNPVSGVLSIAASGWADLIVSHFEKPTKAAWDRFGRALVASAKTDWHDIVSSFGAFRGAMSSSFDAFRHATAAGWDLLWNNTVARVRSGLGDVVNWFHGLPGRILGALAGLGHTLWQYGSFVLGQFWDGLKSVGGTITGWFASFGRTIIGVVKKVLGVFSPSSVFFDIGVNLMRGLKGGIEHGVGAAQAAAQAAASRVANVGSGVQRWAPLVLQALRMEGLSPGLLGDVLYQMQTESGGNPNAINLTDINAQLGDPSRGLMQTIMSTFMAYHWPGTSNNIYDPLANIAAALNYAAHNRGFGSGPGQIGSGHGYDTGGWLPTGVSLAVNRTGRPERVLGPHEAVQVKLVIDAGPSAYSGFLANEIKKYVRTAGGGDVQAAYGYGSRNG